MSWRDPQGAWARRMRRRVLLNLILIVVFLPFWLFWAWDLYVMLTHPSPYGTELIESWIDFCVFGAPLLMVGLGLVFMLRRSLIEYRISRRVPQFDGLLCPACRTRLPVTREQGDCPRCSKPFTTDRVRRYWEQYAFVPQWSLSGWKQAKGSHRHIHIIRRLFAAVRTNPRYGLAWATFFPLAIPLIDALVTSTSIDIAFLNMLPWLLPIILTADGMVLAVHGWKRRSGKTRHCAACDYQQAPSGALPDRCPECGELWTAPGGSVEGEVHRDLRMLGAGGALTALGVMAMFLVWSPAFYANLPKVLPTSVLIRRACARSFPDDPWPELLTRRLSSEQEGRLAEGLLDARLEGGMPLDRSAEAWFAPKAQSGTLPEHLIDRYYSEMLDVWILGPQRAVVGGSVTLAIAQRRRFASLTGQHFSVFAAGYEVEDSPGILLRQHEGMALYQLAKEQWFLDKMIHSGEGLEISLEAVRLGPMRVRFVMWIVAHPQSLCGKPIVWQENGTPVIPEGTFWSKRIEVTHTVEVFEPG